MNIPIFIRSCARDLGYLELCLRSIRKFAKGFDSVVLLVTSDDRVLFKQLAESFTDIPVLLKDYPTPKDKVLGHLAAQCEACYAEKWCPSADLIAFIDSDCVFTEPVTPEDYLDDGRPILCVVPFKFLPHAPWQDITEKVLMIPLTHETMCRHPAVHYPDMLPIMRNFISGQHRPAGAYWLEHDFFRPFVLSRKPTFPWGFSEFNAMGSFVMNSRAWSPRYKFIDISSEPRPKDKLKQFWSLIPPDKPQHKSSGGMIPVEWCKERGI